MSEIAVKRNFKRWAQLGYGSRGVVYLVIGGLALLTAFGEGGGTTDSRGAILEILRQPFGRVLLGLMIVGLLGYVAWRFLQAVKDTDGHGRSAKGIVVRAGLLASSVTHAVLAVWAIGLLIPGNGGSSGGQGRESFLATDVGQIVLAVAGIAVFVAGFAQVYKGVAARFERHMSIPPDKKAWADPVCRFGLIARGIVWFIIGWFLVNSAITASQGEIKGIAAALDAVRTADYGQWLLAVVAAGLFSFGIYGILEALYRRIDMQEV
ncbi:protein of unknown function [Marinobacter daqiaonensis]|uniref:DUF1206 domain-containing protein n=1 Tax=Marinobacter daqiaonensis TaxID=650891 RepID=A0A1I6GJ44_9GAMM|nr:DUF1206 domain-containing protein [Marinobacter daqiaonensis]SFR42198.1 protein of unknown function [Marinobacter daqiaonensis]